MEVLMKLTDLVTGNSLDRTIYGERYLNDTRGSFHDYSDVDTRFDLQGPISHIDLPYTLLYPERCVVVQSEPSEALTNWVRLGGRYRFFWHPDVVRSGLDVCGTVQTQPTSSTRTLLTESNPRVYIKTDLDKKHFRFVRRLQRSSVEHSIAICSDLRTMCDTVPSVGRYAFLPESLGVIVQGGDHEGSGVIFRETHPCPSVEDARVLMPFHSLYASDPREPSDEPLLVQIIKLHSGEDPLNYFVSEIIGPILEAWTLLVGVRGLLPELHGQNTLAEIDGNLKLRRIVHRDFQGIYSDARTRSALGLPLFTKHIAGTEPGTTIQSQYSHVFDGMIGRYLLARLAKIFCAHFADPSKKVASAIRDYHHNIPAWRVADFPSTTYRFGISAKEQRGNEVQFVDSGEKPEFR